VKTYMTITPATAFVSGALVPTAVDAEGRGVSAAALEMRSKMRNAQDATTGFIAWSPPV
jgi:hypothetical protein